MIKPDLVSVVMCVYNTKKEYLVEAVDSVLNQTYQNFELIIVDDCSDDKTLYDDPVFNNEKIVIVKNKINKGPSFARNVGIELAKGKYVAIMDSDDISTSDRLEMQLTFLKYNPEYVACSSCYKEFQGRDRIIKVNVDDFEYYRCCLFFKNNPPLNFSALMARADVLKSIKLDEKIRFGEDWKLWVQLSELGKIKNLPEILSYYRIHQTGLTSLHKKGVKINKSNGAIGARTYVKNKMGLCFTDDEDEVLYLVDTCKCIKPSVMASALKKLLLANNKAHYYDQNALQRKCDRVWETYIMKINNPLYLFGGLFLSKNRIIKIKFRQFANKFIFRKAKKKQKKVSINKYFKEHPNCPVYNNVMCYYWSKVDNFGDYLSRVVFEYMTKKIKVNSNKKRKVIYGIGSILNLVSVDSTIWGSGLRLENDAAVLAKKELNLDFRLVRGPLTHQKLLEHNIITPSLYGDPALILPMIYTPKIPQKRDDYLVISHYVDYDYLKNEINNDLIVNAGTLDFKSIIDKIVGAKKVISTSLHGIILAEAYGVPAIWLKNNGDVDDFKFNDYYYSTNRTRIIKAHSINEAINLKPMEMPKNIQELQKNIIGSFPFDIFGN